MALGFDINEFGASIVTLSEVHEDYGDIDSEVTEVILNVFAIVPNSSSYEDRARTLSARFGLKNARDFEPYVVVNPNGIILWDGRYADLLPDDFAGFILTAELFGNKYESQVFDPSDYISVGSGLLSLTFTKVNS